MSCKYLIVPLLFFLSCSDKILQRIVADYYPDKVGASWFYKSDTLELFLKVDAETTWANCDATLFLINGTPQYRSKQDDGIYYYFDIKIPYGGFEYPIETRYRRWIEMPLLANNSWGDTFLDSIDVASQPVRIEHRINGRIIGVESIETPFGKFDNVYHLEIINVCRISSSIYSSFDSTLINEYYAPDIGLIAVDSSGTKFDLHSYQGL